MSCKNRRERERPSENPFSDSRQLEDKGKFLFEYLMIIKYLFYKTLGHFKVFLHPLPRSPHELYEFMNDKFDSLWNFLISLGCPMILILLLVRYLHKILSFCVRKVMFMFLRRSPEAALSGVFARKACRKIGFSIRWSNLKSSGA